MRLPTIPAIGAALVAALLAAPAAAQVAPDLGELSLDQLLTLRVDTVFGASRYEQKLTRAPASVTIVTREEIRRYGYQTLADVLRGVRGIYIGYDRNYSTLGVRGFARPGDNNTRILLLVDGHRMNDPLYNAAQVGREALLDVDLIERVEVIRGPSSSIYGSSAFFGVVNVVTRRASDVQGAELTASAGSRGTYEGRASFGKALANGVDLLVSGTAYESNGNRRLYYPEFDTPESNHGIAERSDGESSRNTLVKVGYRGFTLTGSYAFRKKDVPTATYGTVFNHGERTSNERAFLDLAYSRDLSADVQVSARAFYDHFTYRADYPYDFSWPPAPRDVVLDHDDNRGDDVGAEAQVRMRIAGRHTILIGGEYRKDLVVRQKNTLDPPYTTVVETDSPGRSLGLYAQGELALGSRVLVNTGLRLDHHPGFGATLSPRLGLIYAPAVDTTLKALYGRAYRAPNAYESDFESPGYNRANPFLEPETIETLELVAEQKLSGGLKASGSAYVYRIDDIITQLRGADGVLVFQNAYSVRARGIELELDGAYASGLLFRASWAIQRADIEATGEELDNSPRHLIKLNASLPVYRDLVHAGVEARLTSALETISGKEAPRSIVVDATLRGNAPLRGLQWSASLYNLFDEAYASPGSVGNLQDTIRQDGRGFRLKLGYRF